VSLRKRTASYISLQQVILASKAKEIVSTGELVNAAFQLLKLIFPPPSPVRLACRDCCWIMALQHNASHHDQKI
jgi:hypothetical protein